LSRASDKPRAYKGTKFYNYPDPLPVENIRTILLQMENLVRQEKDKNLNRVISVKSPISNLNVSEGNLFGTVYYKIQKPTGEGRHYWKTIPFDFIFCREPSVFILHGPRSLMPYVKKDLENAIYPRTVEDEAEEDADSSQFFIPHSFDRADGKYIIKKIVKRIEAQNARNILYEPHFQKLRENRDVRGGESFWRRDGHSAEEDEKFCYLFELCTYWQPELVIYSCGGIVCPTITEPITVIINSDFSFSFSHKILKTSLDSFWNSLVLPIMRENTYEEEKTECVQNATDYSRKLASSR